MTPAEPCGWRRRAPGRLSWWCPREVRNRRAAAQTRRLQSPRERKEDMPSAVQIAGPRRALAGIFVATALAGLALVLAAGTSAAPARDRAISPKALALHDGMRALWQSHGTWTERAIVDFAGGLPDTQPAIARLMQNQTEIGNAIKPFYGRRAGNRLTALLKGHISAAVG